MDVGRLRAGLRLAPALLLACAAGCASVFGPTTATSFMRIVETDNDPNSRFKAYQSLGNEQVYDDAKQKAKAAALLAKKLEPGAEPNASRAMICRTLGALGDPSARDAMIRLCRDPDPLIRAEAYYALGKIGRPEDSTVLMQGMTLDLDDHCKAAAIEALGQLKQVDPRTEGYLVRAMDSDDPRIRYAALQSLRKISRKDLGARPEPWREYILAKYGDKIEPPKVQVAEMNSFDPSAAMASIPGPATSPAPAIGAGPARAFGPAASVAPGAPPSETDEFGMPYQKTGLATVPPQAPGQKPLPGPAGGPRGIISKVLGY